MRFYEKAVRWAEKVINDEIPACKKIKLTVERFVDDLERSESDDFPYYWDLDAIDHVCEYFETLPHVKGEWASRGELLDLLDWQVFGLANIYGWKHKENPAKRRFRFVYWSTGRKSGKSFIAGGVALYGGFEDGEFGSEVYCGATKEKQSLEVFMPAKKMAQKIYGSTGEFEILKRSITRESDGSKFEPLVGDPGDGASPHVAIVDEYHEHPTDALYDTMATGQGARRNSLMFVITTAGYLMNGPCHIMYQDLNAILEKRITDETSFIFCFEADDDDHWLSEEALEKANPNLDVSVFRDYLHSLRNAATRNPLKENTFKTKHLNRWVGSKVAWLKAEDWSACGDSELKLEDFEGEDAYISIDLSGKIDLTSIGIVIPLDPSDPEAVAVFEKTFLPRERIDDHEFYYARWQEKELIEAGQEQIDYAFIEKEIKELHRRFNVKMLVYDPWQSQYLVSRLEEQGDILCWSFSQNYANYNEATRFVEGCVTGKKLKHNKSKLLEWATNNVKLQKNPDEHVKPVKESPDSPNKIDPMQAIIMAIAPYVKAVATMQTNLYDKSQ